VALHVLLSCDAFAPPTITSLRVATPLTPSRLSSSPSDDNSFVDKLTYGWELFQKSKSDGYDFKQSVTIAIAGEYDAAEIQAKIKEEIESAPCVMFTWDPSPDCKKAIKYLDIAGASYKNVRLDDPWSEGNPIRAELGKMVGRSSVPCIFVDGKYVGGFDGGVGEDSPGILEMAFKGTLREKLSEVGAL
jgi:glutaredoxin 3